MLVNDTNQPYLTALNAAYGGSGATVSGTAMPIATIRANHVKFAKYLASCWAPGSQFLKDYHGDFYSAYDDKEVEAWAFIKKTMSSGTNGIKLLDSTLKGIKLLPEGPDKVESLENDKQLRSLLSNTSKDSLYGKHHGMSGNDIFKMRLFQNGANTVSIDINTDF